MLHALRPGHFTDVHQTFDSLFQFHECAVISNADHSPVHVCSDWIAMRRIQPWIGSELLEAQRDSLLLLIELQDFDLDLISDIYEILGMS